MSKNILEELKKLDIIVMKKLFHMAKNLNTEYRITPTQMTIIKFLIEKNENVCFQKELYSFTERGKSTISSVITTMEKNGLIIRDLNTDSKLTTLSLTEKSKNIFQKMQKNLEEFNNIMTEGLTDKDINTFITVINTLKKNINKKGD